VESTGQPVGRVPAWADRLVSRYRVIDDCKCRVDYSATPGRRGYRTHSTVIIGHAPAWSADYLLLRPCHWRVLPATGSCSHSVGAMRFGSESRLSWECPSRPAATVTRTFGDLVRHLRQEAGLSQRELAGRLGTTQSAVARLEAGLVEPRLATMERLALALGEDLLIHVRGKELV
jgi:DNA-binding XRE family transcriptional regulator